MAMFNVARAFSRPFHCRDVEAIVEGRGACEETVWHGGCEEPKLYPAILIDGASLLHSDVYDNFPMSAK
jgi:hypothetical protein